MKRLLLFLFTLAFLSLLSSSAFAQWGSTVTVSNDAQYLDAMHNSSVQYIAFERGYYSSIGKELQVTDMMIKNQPKSSGTSKAPLAACVYATQKVIAQCWNEFTADHINLLASRDATFGTCTAPDIAGWKLVSAMSAEIGGVAVAAPTIVQDAWYTAGSIDYYPAHATGFVNGGVYYFSFGFADGTLLISPFRIWKLPSVNLGADFTVCMNNLSMTLYANNPIAAYSGLPVPQKNGVLSYFWTVTPGTATITNNTLANPTFSTSTPGVYTVTLAVTEFVDTYQYGDANATTIVPAHSCTDVDSYIITVSNVTSLITSHTNVSCFGGANGTATVTPSGGTLPYTYSWNPSGQTTATATGLVAGTTYTVTVGDANKCTATASVTISQPTALNLTETHVNVLCFGNASGSIDLTVTGGTPAYGYLWTACCGGIVPTVPDQTHNQDLTGLTAGTYTVTVTDANGCTATLSVAITQPAAVLATTEQHVPVLCFGNATGSIDLNVTGGTTAYTYLWSNGATTQDLSGLVAGTYSVTVTDAHQCTTTRSVIITQPATGLSTTETHVPVKCYGDATGSIDLTVLGGTTAYTYLWSNGATTQDLSGLIAGTYSVTVTDAGPCTTTRSVTITQPAAALTSTATHVDIGCYGNLTGSATAIPAGGTPPYTYSWNTTPTPQTTVTATGLAIGTYTVTVKDANLCSATASATITQPFVLETTVEQVNVLCFGNATGSINLTVLGGTTAYTYLWSNGATTQDLSGLLAGTYSVTITDAGQCTTTRSVSITQPAAALTSTATHVNVDCFGNPSGSINITVNGGTLPYTYAWTATLGGVIPIGQETGEDLTGLVAGTYSVTVTDANGCITICITIITQPAFALATTETHLPVLCYGNATGSINLSVTGGTTAYTYLWSNSATTQDLSGLIAGTYSVTVTDANLCTTTRSVTITQPAEGLATTEQHVPVLCFGNATGSIDLNVTGGTTAYGYVWTATLGGIVPAGQANLQDLTLLKAGTYSVTVTDANLCTTTRSVSITQPAAPLAVTLTPVNIDCYGDSTGTITAVVTGGTISFPGDQPVRCPWFAWTASAGGFVPAVQANNQILTGLADGTYTVTVTDCNGCTATASVTITQQPYFDVVCHPNITVCDLALPFNLISLGGFATVPSGIPGTYEFFEGALPTNVGDIPSLGMAKDFVLFTAAGAFNNDGASSVVGNIGSDDVWVVGFPNPPGPGTIVGNIYGPGNVQADQAKIDVLAAYGFLSAQTCGTLLGPTIVTSTLTPGIYCAGGAATISLNGIITLDGQLDPNSVFIIKVNGALSVGASASIVLTNSASIDNVFWQINGAFDLGGSSVFRGTVIADGAITLYGASVLHGRALSVAGAIETHNVVVDNPMVASTAITTFNPATAGVGPHTITYVFTNDYGCVKTCTFVITVEAMGEAALEGQVKYFNPTETYMETPFPTDIYGTKPPDYFYVALYNSNPVIAALNLKKAPLVNPLFDGAIDWQKVDIVQEENGSGTITKNLMSYFKFDVPLDPSGLYYIRVWDGSNMWQESVNLGTATGMVYNEELGSSYTWNNWGGVTGIDALGMQYMINFATQINATPYNWNWIGDRIITSPPDLHYGFYSNPIANVNDVNDITALDALTTQYRIAGLQPTFPNMVPNFRVAGRFVDTLPRITFPRAFTTHNFPIDLRFTKSMANYTYFTPAVDNYYQSDTFRVKPFFLAQNDNFIACPDLGYINIYYTATGDVNASYVPPSHNFKSAEIAMTLKYENELVAHKGEIIDIPISVDRNADLGSISLGMTFRNDQIKVLEVPGYDVVNIDNEKGIVRVVWVDMKGRSVSADDAIVTVKALILSDIAREDHLFELEPMTELGDVQAQKIENVNLKTFVVSTKPIGPTQLFVANYPNPFSNTTKISYYLPEAGSVSLVVYNSLGAKLTTLVDQYQTEGTYIFNLKLSDLKPGAYFYRLVLKGTKDTYSATRNMVVIE